MKLVPSLRLFIALLASAALTPFMLADEHAAKPQDKTAASAAGSLIKVDAAGVSAEWLASARAAYPLETCVVSGEKMEGGSMGGPKEYVYRRQGDADHLVRFCCQDCVKDFGENPTKYLLEIDGAKAAKAKGAPAK